MKFDWEYLVDNLLWPTFVIIIIIIAIGVFNYEKKKRKRFIYLTTKETELTIEEKQELAGIEYDRTGRRNSNYRVIPYQTR